MAPKDFLQEYVEEVRENLRELEDSLLTLEQKGRDEEEIRRLFRAAHSIKGASSYMGFEDMAHLTHEIESVVARILKESLPILPQGITTLLGCVDFVSKSVASVQESEQELSLPESIMEALAGLIPQNGSSPKPSPVLDLDEIAQNGSEAQQPIVFLTKNPPDEFEATDIIEEDDEELLGIYISSLNEQFLRIQEILSKAGKDILVPEDAQTLRRLTAKLISSSQYMDYEPVVSILKEWEADLDSACSLNQATGAQLLPFFENLSVRLSASLPDLGCGGLNVSEEDTPSKSREFTACDESDRPIEEEDEELYGIFLDSFQQLLSELLATFQPREHALTEEKYDCIRQILKKMGDSCRYMGYDSLRILLDDWEESIRQALERGAASGLMLGGFNALFCARLERILPGLKLPPLGAPLTAEEEAKRFEEEVATLLTEADLTDLSTDEHTAEKLQDPAPAQTDNSENGEQQIKIPLNPPLKKGGIDPLNLKSVVSSITSEESSLSSPPEERSASSPPLSKGGSGGIFDHLPAHPEEHTAAIASPKTSRITVVAEDAASSPVTLRVDAGKVDQLLNQVGELVVTRSEFIQTSFFFRELLREIAAQGRLSKQELRRFRMLSFRLNESTVSLGRVTNNLQDSVMRIRMLPISYLFQRLPRIVRDQSLKLGKKVELVIDGEDTEIDRRVLERMYDPIVQFLRNAIAHGIESPQERLAAGKAPTGTIRLAAYQQGDYVALEIEDDGRGIDTAKLREILQSRPEFSSHDLERFPDEMLSYAIFLPGLSTRSAVDASAGRGIGLDVVKENVERMNGTVDVESFTGQGTRFTVSIPLTVAIIRALLVRTSGQIFTLPLTCVSEIHRYRNEKTHSIDGFQVMNLRGRTIPLIHLSKLLNLPEDSAENKRRFVAIVTTSFQEVGLVVDGLIGEREVVIKPIDDSFHSFEGFSGATILGDGTVSLILDVSVLLKTLKKVPGAGERL